MAFKRVNPVVLLIAGTILWVSVAFGATESLGNGFSHHGVATPVSCHRGVVSTKDGNGRDTVLAWLFDCRGGYAVLMMDAATGASEEIPMPFPPGGDCPYASILSSGNKFYTHFNSHFAEFDPASRTFTFSAETAPQMAMAMTEDDAGVIWSASYPNSGVVSFDPATRAFKDYGSVYKQNWAQYPRYVAADDKGWVYLGVGTTAAQVLAVNSQSGETRVLFPEEERTHGSGVVYRYMNGRVYGYAGNGGADSWYEFYDGTRTKCVEPAGLAKKAMIADSQGLFHREFPSGKVLETCDLVDRVLVVADPKTGEKTTAKFEYSSEGAHIMGVAAAPDGSLCGGTAFPMRFFSYNPKTDSWINRDTYGQWNTVARQGDRFFVGGYGGGFLLEWDPANEWIPTEKGNAVSNPLFLAECAPAINRPHELLAHPDGKRLVLAGTPGYGLTGGGLYFWDRESSAGVLVEHTSLLPEHSTASLAAIADDRLLGGTTTSPGTGGEKKATTAELYILNMANRQIEWHEVALPGVQEYTDLCSVPKGLIFGVADTHLFFVFDPAQRKVVHREDTASGPGATCYQQGPRIFVTAPDGTIYMLFRKGIARVNPDTYAITMVAESPVPIQVGGDFVDGRIYFGNGSHLYSCQLPAD